MAEDRLAQGDEGGSQDQRREAQRQRRAGLPGDDEALQQEEDRENRRERPQGGDGVGEGEARDPVERQRRDEGACERERRIDEHQPGAGERERRELRARGEAVERALARAVERDHGASISAR